jgi:hypothetical protein
MIDAKKSRVRPYRQIPSNKVDWDNLPCLTHKFSLIYAE